MYPRTAARLGILVSLSLMAVSCTTVPITGRKQFNIIPKSNLHAMSYESYREFLAQHKESTDVRKTQMVKSVGGGIQGAVERYFADRGQSGQLSGYEWEFHLIESKEQNAWCMPGGKVVIYTGILPITKTETGLAVVMGHEVAHAIAEHGGERMSHGMVTQLGGMALSEALKTRPQQTQQLFMTAYGIGAQVAVLLPFSRTHESEADRLGLIFMAMAGYDPREATDFWQRMADSAKGGAPPEFLSTHPSHATRISQIESWLPEALQYYDEDARPATRADRPKKKVKRGKRGKRR